MLEMSRRGFVLGSSCTLLGGCGWPMGGDPQASRRSFSVAVLSYHQFGENVASTLMVTRTTLEDQLRTIAGGGFKVVSARQLVEAWTGLGPDLPEQSCVLTIDDGYRSIYTIFFPLAVKFRIPRRSSSIRRPSRSFPLH